ncbi:hypothetical protein BI084_gp66 [Gordonia phage Terapin]|uniref:Uncharacterized protein n=5 Tax=Terapinvirus terapin TaxID=2734283 RepID=A0A345MBA5_9CAUD|nr:hypothetical protein BI084_gp66 [Gordonia phage Terapin]AVP43342.1 hypothetical protein PBI_DJOKOVIC_65 [Gordonia phage Djokovic]AXH67776.1 hypothetical protein SEA_BEYONCAGE_65 [Gordonia phage Beyoncage]QOC56210.1 hypothetical protein SEA_SIENNA_65 [Gordonia phage Sienna]QOC56635.1 hypothetical protein SEA_BITESIZE_65 [Gordonia phage BiteSize]AOE44878.1 hypothetical protein SEA_TERAPIN_66 [Gordonia phage Terapin]
MSTIHERFLEIPEGEPWKDTNPVSGIEYTYRVVRGISKRGISYTEVEVLVGDVVGEREWHGIYGGPGKKAAILAKRLKEIRSGDV